MGLGIHTFHGGLVQLGERLPCTQKVKGSNPLSSTIFCLDSSVGSSIWLLIKGSQVRVLFKAPCGCSSVGYEHLPYKQRVRGSSPCTRTINKNFIIYLFINNRRCSAIIIILFGGFYRVLKSPSILGTWSSLVMALALGARNREFESLSPDHKNYNLKIFWYNIYKQKIVLDKDTNILLI